MKMLKVKLLLMIQENQLLLPRNRLNKLRMVSQLRLLENKLKRLKIKSLDPVKFSRKNRKNQFLLLWSTRKVNLKMLRAKQSSMIQENQSKPPKNRSN